VAVTGSHPLNHLAKSFSRQEHRLPVIENCAKRLQHIQNTSPAAVARESCSAAQ